MGAADDATVLAYRAGSFLARLLPSFALDGVGLAVGASFDLVGGRRRRMVARHQARVAGRALGFLEERRLVQGVAESYARYWAEAFRLPEVGRQELDDGFDHDGLEHVDAGLAAGNGVILALPHLGGWEWAGAWMSAHGYRLTVVVEPLEPPELFEWFVALRKALGFTIIPLGGDAGATVLGALRRNEIVCLLCDRDIGGGGVPVEFFGERTTLPGGPATLALRTGAVLLPTAVYFTERSGHLGLVRPSLDLTREGKLRTDVARVTQALAGELEALVRAAPEQWHLLQPNWPSDYEQGR